MPKQNTTFESSGKTHKFFICVTFRGRIPKFLISPQVTQSLYLKPSVTLLPLIFLSTTTDFPSFVLPFFLSNPVIIKHRCGYTYRSNLARCQHFQLLRSSTLHFIEYHMDTFTETTYLHNYGKRLQRRMGNFIWRPPVTRAHCVSRPSRDRQTHQSCCITGL